ncbi:MAG: tripartite tricarboxylate transporter TctB family protein [Streptosporangiales bacterium]
MNRARVRSIWLACLLAVAVPYTVLAFGMEWRTVAGRMGPGFFPRLIGLGLSITLAIALARSLRQGDGGEGEGDGNATYVRALLVMLGATALYAVVFEVVGALVASVIYMVTVLAAINPRRWVMNVSIGVLLPLALYLMFQTWLNAGLPAGVLGIPL